MMHRSLLHGARDLVRFNHLLEKYIIRDLDKRTQVHLLLTIAWLRQRIDKLEK